jgi:hypothetical protein
MAEEILDIEPEELGDRECRELKSEPRLKRAYVDKWGSTGECRVR